MRPVNLLPSDGAGERRRRPPVALLAAGAAPLAAAALVYLGWSTAHQKASQRADELAAVQAQVDRLAPKAATASAAAQLASLQSSRTAAVQTVLAQRVAWDGLLDRIARVLPGDVWLQSLNLQSPAPFGSAAPAPGAAQGLQLTGSARSQAAVAHTLARLSIVPGLNDVTLASTTSSGAGKQTVVQFQVSATVGGGS
ncbi:MAG TPA: PilN domain-containing protein [Gaiellaceae bacterium]|jgi:Tfp pilus assembly protein PilN